MGILEPNLRYLWSLEVQGQWCRFQHPQSSIQSVWVGSLLIGLFTDSWWEWACKVGYVWYTIKSCIKGAICCDILHDNKFHGVGVWCHQSMFFDLLDWTLSPDGNTGSIPRLQRIDKYSESNKSSRTCDLKRVQWVREMPFLKFSATHKCKFSSHCWACTGLIVSESR